MSLEVTPLKTRLQGENYTRIAAKWNSSPVAMAKKLHQRAIIHLQAELEKDKKARFTAQRIMDIIGDGIEAEKEEGKPDHAVRLKYLEFLAKHAGIFGETPEEAGADEIQNVNAKHLDKLFVLLEQIKTVQPDLSRYRGAAELAAGTFFKESQDDRHDEQKGPEDEGRNDGNQGEEEGDGGQEGQENPQG